MEMIRLNSTTWRLALGFPHGIVKFDVDLSGDYISGSGIGYELTESTSAIPYVKGLEFSESGDYLYFTNHITPNNQNAVQYLDLNTSTVSALNVSPLNQSDFIYSQIEIGGNGKMYFAYSGGLAALVDPENPTTSNWEPLSVPFTNSLSDAGFPSQDKQRVYLLPDQIDGMNYYDHFFITKECCMLHAPYDAFNATATTSATWSPGDNPFNQDPDCDVVLIHNELLIPEGVHITIEDMRFEFFENARVVVESGGSLTLERTIFTSGPCGCEMWLGVEVHGHPQLSQNFTNQGFLDMKDNSIIEHAYIGALAGSRDGSTNSSSFGYGGGGGIIRARDSRFRNNKRDVQIQRYQATSSTGQIIPNFSKFTNCDFLTDGLLNHTDVLPEYHALLYLVSGVPFINCSFRNTASFSDLPIKNRGTGVYSASATFQVTGDNQTYEPAHDALPISDDVHQSFYRLNMGILSIGGENHPFTANKMEFQLNRTGILVLGSCFETITFNNFEVPEAGGDYPSLDQIHNLGAYLMSSHSFTIEENYFFSTPQVSRNGGLVIDNSSLGDLSVENEVYRNHFYALNFGIGVKNDNRGETAQMGLQTRCNMFSTMDVSDIVLASLSEWRANQGSTATINDLTNNSFSTTGYPCTGYRDIRVSPDYGMNSDPVNGLTFRYFHSDHPITTPDMDYLHPTCPQLNMVNNLPAVYINEPLIYSEHCPSNFTSVGGGKWPLAELEEKQATATSNMASAEAIYKATIDGGDTEDIIDLLQNILDEESAYLRDLLLARFPLSREALMAAVNAAESFDPWHLTQVLVANSRLPGDVYLFLKDNEVLSPFFIQFVDDAQTSGMASFRTLLKAEITYRSYEKSHAERAIHRHYLHHSDSLDVAEWSNYLASRDEPYYQLYRIGEYNDQGQTGLAQSLLDSLNADSSHIEWVQFMINLAVADTVTLSDIDKAWDFFYNDPVTTGNAWGWLMAHGELDSIPAFDYELEHRNLLHSSSNKQEKPERFLQAWPNPAKDRVMLTYPREAEGMGIIQVFNTDGRLMHEFTASDAGFQEINLTGWPNGLYIAKLIVNGKDFETVKISVVK